MKRAITFLLFTLFVMSMSAYDFKSGNFYYNITSDVAPYTVEVTYETETYYENYRVLSTATIPASVTYNGTTYSVTSIGGKAFFLSKSLTSVTIPNSVTSIGYWAFYGCSALTSIAIPNSVTSIGWNVFNDCNSLTSITIPNSVTSIGKELFASCASLSSVVVEPGNTTYDSRENSNAIIETATNTLVVGCNNSIIPNTVTSIGDSAFRDCDLLTSITIPKSVTSIGRRAFSFCYELNTMVVEEGNTTYDSRENCNAIIETATNTLVAGCKNTIIPNTVTKIGDSAFDDCTSLASITIPESVISIGEMAFHQCHLLTSITIPNSVTSIGWAAFNYCPSLTSITIPNSVTSIGGSAFINCTSLTSVTIGSGVKSIGEYAFSHCPSLTSMVVEPGNTTYDSRENCNAIIEKATNTLIAGCKNTIIPNTVTSIGNSAFQSCTYLASITIPNSVTSIGYAAFSGCTSLTSITCEATTPPVLELYVFPSELTTAYIPCGTKSAYEASDWASQVSEFIEEDCPEPIDPTWQITYTSTDGNIVTPDETDVFGANIVSNEYKDGQGVITFDGPVTTIGEQAFHFCQNLASITIPNSVTTIGDLAFNECSSLVSITIPNSVTSIHTFAFADCSSLIEVEIPKSVISIGDSDGIWWACQGIFMGCNNLQKIVVEEGNPIFDSRDNCNAIIETATNTLIAGCPNTEIPNGIKRIGAGAFRECNALGDIDIPSSVNVIGEAAFYGTGITNVVIPSNCIVENSTKGSQRTALFGAFAGCEQLTNIVIPEGTTRIASGMLAGCSSLESLTIPASVTSIGEWAFYNCDALTSITIPDGVMSIEEGTFMRCYKLTSITIPRGVTNIGYYAFGECSLLASVTCEATTPPMLEDLKGSPVFTSSPICYIPCGTKAAYEASDWAQYVSEFVEDCDNGSYSRNVRIGYNTICLPHGSSNFTGATFYEIAHILKNKKKIFFDEVKTLEAGKPYIFYPHSNEVTVYYDNTTSAIPLSHNGLHGTFDGITAASNFLKGKYLVVGDRMVLCGNGCSLAANRAYIELDEIPDKEKPAIPGIKRVSMDYSEENATTALDNITDESIVAPMQEGIYDILGRKVDAPTVSGFYIINGKKVFVAL